MTPRLVDMHCHLDHMADAERVARDAAAHGIAVFDTTVTPADAARARARFAGFANVRVGCGLHPWWLADGRCGAADIAAVARDAKTSPFIGEIGLDYAPRHESSRALQHAALERILDAVAEHPLPHRAISLHAVRAASDALNALERRGLIGPGAPNGTACIFHWFSGSSEELTRARRLGCFFSINEHMLASKRGRAYARAIPEDRLLLETDAPPVFDEPCTAAELEASLTRTLIQLTKIRSANPETLATSIAATSVQLLGLIS